MAVKKALASNSCSRTPGIASERVTAVVDANYCFTYVNAGRQGRLSDGCVFVNWQDKGMIDFIRAEFACSSTFTREEQFDIKPMDRRWLRGNPELFDNFGQFGEVIPGSWRVEGLPSGTLLQLEEDTTKAKPSSKINSRGIHFLLFE
ncbi:hypothetical protein PR048_032720 [Dryococelus australis]|uniref:Uncharacterized protein n=1 Tax=Dryococelus australis TaxID=614101 RepID=A0ABQ9G307_9NEOP|nr:hypothetical protein PR048_032720 [Dryococelus australis]